MLSPFLNKTQILSSPHIVCVGLVLCLWLFGYKFSLICGGDLILNLILIIVIKKNMFNPLVQPDQRELGWVGLDPYDGLCCVKIFLTYHCGLGWKNPLTRPVHAPTCRVVHQTVKKNEETMLFPKIFTSSTKWSCCHLIKWCIIHNK